MRKYICFSSLVFSLTFFSCVSSKKVSSSSSKLHKNSGVAESVVHTAESYIGTKYKLGGADAQGMDCSGLLFTVLKKHNVDLPRTSFEQSKVGEEISLKNIRVGDLIFFGDKKDGKNVNHAGIVSYSKNGEVKFIHSSTSKGVREDNLAGYWLPYYVVARRVI